jgi:type III secretory pathway lipoprotein EscJ
VRGTQQKGQVSAVFSTEELGDVAARFEVMTDRLSGLIVTKTEEAGRMMIEGQAMLKEALSEIEGVASETNVELNIVTEPQLDTERFQFDGKQNKPYERNSENEVQTAVLYQTAKAFIRSVIKISETV